ncbi:MAG: NAD(P)-dependent oxidoreductase [Chlamydiae bacterium]|nr:NAD(P)-dependent oxidoreductase [Chlamydiota bacterium]
MEKVLVTGAAGYLGSVLVKALLEKGYRVTVLDNLLYGQASLLQYCSHPKFGFIRGDARDERVMKELVKSQDAIIPLAAIVGMKACDLDPIMTRSVNLDAILMLNRLRSKSQRVISPCTNSGYGTKSGAVHCTEETPLEPVSLYGETKIKAEAELLSSSNTISLRLATVFGPSPRMRLDLLVNDFTYRAITDGFLVIYEKDFKRNYVHIEDVADCFCFCLEHFDAMKGHAYNVGLSDANLSKAELAEKIKKQVPHFYIHYADVGFDPDKRNYIVSNDKIKAKGFQARHSLDEGIEQLIKLYKMLPLGNFKNA